VSFAAPAQAKPPKPKLRGVTHVVAAFVAALAGVLLITHAPTVKAAWAAGIYSWSLVMLFGISAVYHVPMWQPRPRMWLRRMDHSAIFILIAGTYTPICLLGLHGVGMTILIIVWAGAGLGILQSMLWPKAPKWVTAILYVALGWIVVWEWQAVHALLGGLNEILLAIGGFLYTAGAVIYAAHKPNPWPKVFGYHEIFHLLVIIAAALHFIAITRVVLASG
jgi:hemolysin III